MFRTGKLMIDNWDMMFFREEAHHGQGIWFGRIHAATVRGDLLAVRTIVAEGSKIDERDRFGHTALHLAAW